MPTSPLTALHRARGLPASPINASMILQAIEIGVVEDTDLDWKSVLPNKNPEWQTEFTKDVAAMANSRGGMIVYGVKENRDTSAAAGTVDVDISAGTQQRLRRAAQAHIRPFVSGIRFEAIKSPDSNGLGTLVMHVPASADAPHQYGGDGTTSAVYPYRSGPQTHFLREFEIERAYRERTTRALEYRKRLNEALAATHRVLTKRRRTWITFVATPAQSSFDIPKPLPRETVLRVVADAEELAKALVRPASPERVSNLRHAGILGLVPSVRRTRKWVIYSGPVGTLGIHLRLELHDDGTVLLAIDEGHNAVGVNPSSPATFQHMPVARIENLVVDGVALTAAAATHFGRDGTWLSLIDFTPMGVDLVVSERPSADRLEEEDQKTLVIAERSNPLESEFEPVELEMGFPATDDDLRAAAAAMATGILEQFSYEGSILLRPRRQD